MPVPARQRETFPQNPRRRTKKGEENLTTGHARRALRRMRLAKIKHSNLPDVLAIVTVTPSVTE